MDYWVREVMEELMAATAAPSNRLVSDLKRIQELLERRPDRPFRNPALESIAEAISDCTEIDQLSALMWSAAIECGFQHATIYLLSHGTSLPTAKRILTSFSPKWLRTYFEKKYQFVDPILLKAHEHEGGFRFSDITSTAPQIEKFWQDAGDHGVGDNGLCYVIRLVNQAKFCVAFYTADPPEIADEHTRIHASDLSMIARLGAESFADLIKLHSRFHDKLTDSELRFLHTLIVSDEPSKAWMVLPQFGDNISLQTSIRRKLGVKSLLQAVAIASKEGWFDDLGFSADDVVNTREILTGWEVVAESGDGCPEPMQFDVELPNRTTSINPNQTETGLKRLRNGSN